MQEGGAGSHLAIGTQAVGISHQERLQQAQAVAAEHALVRLAGLAVGGGKAHAVAVVGERAPGYGGLGGVKVLARDGDQDRGHAHYGLAPAATPAARPWSWRCSAAMAWVSWAQGGPAGVGADSTV